MNSIAAARDIVLDARRAARGRLRARRCADDAPGLGQGAAGHGRADASGAHRRRVCREVFPEDSVLVADGGNATDLGHVLPPGHACRTRCSRPSSSACSAPACAGRGAGHCAARQAGVLHHRRRRDGLSFAGGRDRRAQQRAGDLHRALRQAVGHGEDEPAVHAAAVQDDALQAPRSRRDDQGRPGRDRVRQARPRRWAPTASGSPTRRN